MSAGGGRLPAWVEELRAFDWRSLGESEALGLWPKSVRVLLCAVLFAACLAGGYALLLRPPFARLDSGRAEEAMLRAELTAKAPSTAQLPARRAELRSLENAFAELQARLAGAAGLPGLLEDVGMLARDGGLELSRIELRDEEVREHYVERPIDLELRGGYHALGGFVSGVAALPRIVTLHDFSIGRAAANEEAGALLSLRLTLRSYRQEAEER